MSRHRVRTRLDHAPGHATDAPATAEELRTSIATNLRDVVRMRITLRDLTSTRQPDRLGFLTPEAKRAQGRQIAKDRRDHALRLKEGQAVGPGESPAPGNISTISLLAQIPAVVRKQTEALVAHLRDAGHPATIGATGILHDAVNALTDLTREVDDTAALSSVLHAIAHLRESADRIINGNHRRLLDGPCPWCQHKSLVLNLNDATVTCERDPEKPTPCICADPLCECKQRPVAHRHTWHRNRGASATGWWGLVDQWNHVPTKKEHHR